jgi:hypothetical protein
MSSIPMHLEALMLAIGPQLEKLQAEPAFAEIVRKYEHALTHDQEQILVEAALHRVWVSLGTEDEAANLARLAALKMRFAPAEAATHEEPFEAAGEQSILPPNPYPTKAPPMTEDQLKETAASLATMGRLFDGMAKSHPSLSRGQVWCTTCGATEKVGVARAFVDGWPKCCGHTMTIDSPEERRALASTGEKG